MTSTRNDTAVVFTDINSKLEDVLEHDFSQFVSSTGFEKEQLGTGNGSPFHVGATKESRLRIKRICPNLAEKCTSEKDTKTLSFMKSCRYCRKSQKDKPEAKFMYCIRCRLVCYCSKDCQQANWKDHKLVCKQNSDIKSKSAKAI